MRTPTITSILVPLAVLALVTAMACSDDAPHADDTVDETSTATVLPPPLARDGALDVQIVVPEVDGVTSAGLMAAADDLAEAMAGIAGVPLPSDAVVSSLDEVQASATVRVVISDDPALGSQGYTIEVVEEPSEGIGLVVTGTTVGAMYGLYQITWDLGVRYYHPEETYVPSAPEASLPWSYEGTVDTPAFERRGFHEHTQHPLVMSDLLLTPTSDAERGMVSHYLRWLARNKQNVLSWQMLKTVDLPTWLPAITDVIEEAHGYGIEVGMVISFADQQQHMFKLIDEALVDATTGEVVPDEDQITAGLDTLLVAPFDFLTFQFGTSEFTKPADARALAWLDTATGYLADVYPEVRPAAWIHTTCDLHDEKGGYYYHLPLQADEALGAWAHTTMFYDLEHPAPVYACEDFHQQASFMETASGTRPLTYFPESAWWLGFDNNCPVILPVTGWSRQLDIQSVLAEYSMEGHVTFTSGREWTYWMYDHYLTRATWDSSFTWSEYLSSMAGLYGDQGEAMVAALQAWTDLQATHFYEDNPLIYFYLAGELPQDEMGAQAGILARRPKVAFKTVLEYDDEAFQAWKTTDYDMLVEMEAAYGAVLDGLPEALEGGTDLQRNAYQELYTGMYVYEKRIEHAVALYAGVIEARAWYQAATSGEEIDDDTEATALAAATAELESARAISAEVGTLFVAMEDLYRYPLELLVEDKPSSPTAYPFGYLAQTSTAYFWTRRDEQLETLIGTTFETIEEAWDVTPDPVYVTVPSATVMVVPADPMAGAVLPAFVPPLLFGASSYDEATGAMDAVVAVDYNGNGLPDPGTELVVPGTVAQGVWEGDTIAYAIPAKDAAGSSLGDLTIVQPTFRLVVTSDAGMVTALAHAELEGEVKTEELVAIIMTVGGIDEEGVATLLKDVFELPGDAPLPDLLPIHFSFVIEPVVP